MNNKKLFALSFAALLGFGTVGSLGIKAFHKTPAIAGNEAFAETTKADSIGNAISFGNHMLRAGEVDQINSVIGVQILEGNTEGTKSLRFVAALTGYQGLKSAKWQRAAIIDGETTVKAAAEYDIDTVYTSVANAETIKWSTVPSSDYTYYMVYTLANIPAAYDYSAIDVTLSVEELGEAMPKTVNQKANIKGVQGLPENVYGTYTYSAEKKEYAVTRGSNYSSVVDAVIPEDYYEIDGYIAKNPGKVTEAKVDSKNCGVFEGAGQVKHITLPATLKSWGNYMFMSCSNLESFNFPRDLTTWTGSLPTSSKLTDVYWEATNLVTFASQFYAIIPTIHVSASVEHLPANSIFGSSSYYAKKVIYEGTTTEWNALINGSKSGLDIDNVICSDTEFVNYSFNANGGQFADGTTSKVVNAVKGKKVEAPANPTLSGKIFDGWYTAAEGGTLVDVTAPTTADQNLYAHYIDMVGETYEKKISITNTGEGAFDILGERQAVYATFTAPAADRYYIRVDSQKSNLSGDYANYNGTITTRQDNSYTKVVAVDETGAEKTSPAILDKATTYKNAKPAYISNDRTIVVDLAEGESIDLKFISSTYASYTNLTGTLAYNIFTSENDTEETAIAAEYDKDVAITNGTLAQNYIYKQYKFTATETKTKVLSFAYSYSSTYGGYTVKEAGAEGKVVKEGASITSAGLVSLDLEKDKEYILSVYTTTDLTDKTLSFKIEDEPAGLSRTNPIADTLTVGGEAVTIARLGVATTWYKLDVAGAGAYKLSWSNDKNLSYSTRLVKAYDSDGKQIAGSTYSYSSSTKYITFDTTEATTIYIEVGYSGSTTDKSKTFDIKVEALIAGESRDAAISTSLATLVADDSLTLNASATGVWYKFTGTAEEFDWATSSSTATIEIYSSLTTTTVTATITNTAAKCKLTSTSSTYYAKVVETDPEKTSVTIVKTPHVGPLSGSETLGTYYGRYLGTGNTYTYTQTWKETQDGLSWGGSTVYDAVSTEVKDGIRETHAQNGTSDYFSLSDGTRAIAGYWSGSYSYLGYFSKNMTGTNDITSANSECAKTSTLSKTTGTALFKITETDGEASYGAFIDGKAYLNIEIVFMNDQASFRTPKDSQFQLKQNGEVIAQYHVKTAATGTTCAIIEAEDISEYTPVEEAAYAGNWEDANGNKIVIDKDGKSGSINGDACTFSLPDKDGTIYVTSGDYEESMFSYDEESDTITDCYFLGGPDGTNYFEDDFSREAPAAPAYCGVYKKGSFTLTVNPDGSVTWHDGNQEYSTTYVWDEAEKAGKMGALADWDRTVGNKFYFTGDDYNTVKVAFNDEWNENFFSDTLTRVVA